MKNLHELFQTGDWKQEKHTPVIKITVSVGREIPHPNTTAHHISWIEVYFLPDGEKFPYEIGRFEFTAHGASAQGPDTSSIYTVPEVTVTFKTEKSGTILAASYCNIHGLWENSKELKVE